MSEDPDLELLGFHRGERRRRWRLALALGISVAGLLGWLATVEVEARLARRDARLSDAQRAELSALLDRREAVGQQRVAQWNAAAKLETLAALLPGPQRCPLVVKPPEQFSAGAYVKYGTHDSNFGQWSLCLVRQGAAADPCARVYQPSALSVRLRALLAEGEAHSWDLEEAKVDPPAEPPAAVVVADEEVRPTLQPTAGSRVSFVPGTLAGRVWLYSPDQGRMVCAGVLAVRNSKAVDTEFNNFGSEPSPQQVQAEVSLALERDLEVVLRFALPSALKLLSER